MTGSRLRAALVLLLVFAAGLTAGVAADRFGLLPEAARAEVGPERSGRQLHLRHRGQPVIERFADEIGLTTEQRAEIEELLERHRASMRELWREVRPRYRMLIDSVRAEIEATLTPEQVRAYRDLLQKREHEWKADRRDSEREDGDR